MSGKRRSWTTGLDYGKILRFKRAFARRIPMVVNLSIPDELYSQYVEMNKTNPGKAMVQQLKRFAQINPGKRVVILTDEPLAELQRLAEKSLETPEDILKIVSESLHVKHEGVEVKFTEAQRNRMRQDARFWSQDPGVYASKKLQALVDATFGA
jgi:hypothetical protein